MYLDTNNIAVILPSLMLFWFSNVSLEWIFDMISLKAVPISWLKLLEHLSMIYTS